MLGTQNCTYLKNVFAIQNDDETIKRKHYSYMKKNDGISKHLRNAFNLDAANKRSAILGYILAAEDHSFPPLNQYN